MQKVSYLLAAIGFLFILGACTSPPVKQKSETPIALDLNVSENNPRAVPPRFVGMSFEASVLTTSLFRDPSLDAFKNLLKNLGPGVLRFGGFTVDAISWKSRSPNCKEKPALKESDLRSMFGLASEIDWKVILGLNLGCGSVLQAVDEAKSATSLGKKSLMAFEIGNEPNFFAGQKLRPSSYNPTDFIADFNRFQSAIKEVLPEASISGPGCAGLQRSWDWYAAFLQAEDKITLVTQHAYPMLNFSGAQSTNRFPSIGNMLGEGNRKDVLALSKKYAQLASAHNLSLRMTETNSVGGGGTKGVSDVYASALWAAGHLFTLLEAGLVGADFHGEPDADFNGDFYSPIKKEHGIYTPQPEYYGLLFFTQAARGELIHIFPEPAENIKYYAFKEDKTLRLAILNMGSSKADLNFHLASKYRVINTMHLIGKAIDGRDGIYFGEAEIGSNGIWHPKDNSHEMNASDVISEQIEAHSGLLVVLKQYL